MFKTILLATLLLLTPQLLMADATPQGVLTHDSAIAKIMKLSGIDAKIPTLSQELITSFDPYIQQYSKAKAMKMTISVLEAFDKDTMIKTIRNEISQNISLEETLPIMRWYQSDIGREITKIEKKATNDQNVDALFAKKERLLKSKERVYLCIEIEKQAHIIDTLVNTQIEIMKSSLKVSQPKLDDKTVDSYFTTMRTTVKSAIEEPTILSLLKAYENIDVEKMKKYIAFLSRPTTQKLLISANTGISKAVDNGTNMIAKVVKEIK
ncbi:MAG: hypothetical protein QM493_06870 [Sulfurovum sp.]